MNSWRPWASPTWGHAGDFHKPRRGARACLRRVRLPVVRPGEQCLLRMRRTGAARGSSRFRARARRIYDALSQEKRRPPMTDTVKYLLDESRMPKNWYNIMADLPTPPAPVLHPGTKQPVGPADLEPLFPMSLILQEVSTDREIEIPEPVREIYRQWRPSPLFRARRLEKALQTPAKIYYKYEGVSPAGSHKPNTAVAQAFYNKEAGIRKITTETGAGQWGSALAFAGAL